jgi:membrane-bound serine protease (ClpP class)
VTYLLLAVAVWALIAEFSAPGISLPGVIGVVCLVLFAVSASIIPINWAGAGLIILSLIFFIMDLNAPTHGVLTIGGIATFVLGSLLLFRLPRSFQPAVMPQAQVWQAPVWLLVVVIGSTSAILLLALRMGVKAQKLAPVTGRGALLGAVGRVTSIQGDLATVQVRGELWSARPLENEPKLKKGDTVRVTNIEGLTLIVRKEDKE